MEYIILKQYDQVCDYVGQVTSIADKNKAAFGFLSASVYEQMASKGQLWVAVNEAKELKGHLMFGGTMPTLKVFQIYACESVKGHGVGTLLINALKEHAKKSNYHTISARVASDLPANIFWKNVGFPIFRQVKGGEKKRRMINIRGYTLKDNDLFGSLDHETSFVTPSRPVLDRPVYALDLNLLLDIFEARPGYEKVIKIMEIGFQGRFSICITPEFKRELQRQSDKFCDDKILRLAGIFPEIRSQVDISNIAKSLREIVFPYRSLNRRNSQNDESDLRHLAYCVNAGVVGFVTRENAMLRACNDIKEKYGTSIISPDELILDDGDTLDFPSPLNADFCFEKSSCTPEVTRFLKEFLVPKIILETIFPTSPVTDNGSVYVAKLEGCLFGVYFFKKPVVSTGVAMACLYVNEGCPKALAAIDHFLEKALRYRSGFSYRLQLYIGKGQDLTEDTLLRKGFFPLDDHFVKIICNLFLDEKNWQRFSNELKSYTGFSLPDNLPTKNELLHTGILFSDGSGKAVALTWFDFETLISPRFIFNSGKNCTLVPIRENYANGLIGNLTNQLSLLSSHDKALLLEKAYFRSSTKTSLFSKGELIAFYVSGKNSIQEMIGFARITYSDVITIDEATIKVDRQGVLTHNELASYTDNSGMLHVFTFDNFFEFDSRISFKKAKSLGLISSANLVSPERIGPDKLKILIGEAFND